MQFGSKKNGITKEISILDKFRLVKLKTWPELAKIDEPEECCRI
jgi:hypothetical protein